MRLMQDGKYGPARRTREFASDTINKGVNPRTDGGPSTNFVTDRGLRILAPPP